jgi:hypothetical protein
MQFPPSVTVALTFIDVEAVSARAAPANSGTAASTSTLNRVLIAYLLIVVFQELFPSSTQFRVKSGHAGVMSSAGIRSSTYEQSVPMA